MGSEMQDSTINLLNSQSNITLNHLLSLMCPKAEQNSCFKMIKQKKEALGIDWASIKNNKNKSSFLKRIN